MDHCGSRAGPGSVTHPAVPMAILKEVSTED